jgi:hypothetical protein
MPIIEHGDSTESHVILLEHDVVAQILACAYFVG